MLVPLKVLVPLSSSDHDIVLNTEMIEKLKNETTDVLN